MEAGLIQYAWFPTIGIVLSLFFAWKFWNRGNDYFSGQLLWTFGFIALGLYYMGNIDRQLSLVVFILAYIFNNLILVGDNRLKNAIRRYRRYAKFGMHDKKLLKKTEKIIICSIKGDEKCLTHR